ncbi:calcium-translocating P-type ATPase(PMCA-type),putative [Paecilomyces variotii No. 5]|uniref:Calcium-transporting ATPase n=1 Tax=Byssochlamys spectabilis (strain No. 5 / NBRC 109023) TaxID=1356009 RepID=V5I1R4_BYSSN|nr:calcium-translocating P-type ATPase(PMCA-type),putative [Paecilomyces variotii No. 5]
MADGNNQSGPLRPPVIFVNTEQLSPYSELPTTSDAGSPTRPDTNDGSRLTVHHAYSPTVSSLDGETLRSRSGSFNSTADTVGRSRAGSNATHSVNVAYDDVSLSEALAPDHRNEKDFHVEDNKFAFSPGQLNKMLNPKSLAAFQALGGLNGLARGLRTDLDAGLSVDEGRLEGSISFEEATNVKTLKSTGHHELKATNDQATGAVSASQFADRIRIFGCNRLPERKGAGFLKLFWDAYNDRIIILLTIAAVVSLSLGVYETVDEGFGADWIEGVAICVAILIVTTVTAVNDWQKERQFAKLNKRKNDREVKVIRSGKSVSISIYDLTVGDILHLEPGDAVPADGVFISGHGVKCDESSATGESDQMKKTGGHEVWKRIQEGTANKKLDPFILSGSRVLEGVGTCLVTSVGPNSTYGRILLSLQTENDPTPLQVKLAGLADWIGGLGTAAAGLLFVVLLIRFLVQLSGNDSSPAVKGKEFVDILITAVTVIVVAIPEGLPLAVTLALAFATTRMVKENNLVRVLRACETMGNATVICSDKTGTLTQNKMTVVAGAFARGESFSELPSDKDGQTSTMTAPECFKSCSGSVKTLITKSIALNSTAFEEEREGRMEFVGSKTEVALLQMAKDYLAMDAAEERANAEIVQLIPFDSARKCMGVVYREPSAGYRLLVKGAAELMLAPCTAVLAGLSGTRTMAEPLSQETRQNTLDTINSYAHKSLRTIGMVYRDFPSWPPKDVRTLEDDPSAANFEDLFKEMTWLGVVGIQDPLRPEVPAAIRKCNSAGVQVKMVTGDNLTTAAAIATSCGIKTDDGIIMEGPRFRQLSDEEMDNVIPRLQVLARSSPEDKRILVARLKHLGETVAVTGDGTNDGPALKTADVGFSMGIAGTEVAKEASSIILLDDNFSSIVTAIAWGRAVNDAVAKFLQFQITVNITAVALTFVSAVVSSSNESVLNAVQLLWVNLIMDTFAALALATDGPTDKILDRKPAPKNASLFTMTMWKMIFGQAIYQLAVTFVLYFAGGQILGYDLSDPHKQLELNTIVFNTFVWMQIFNEFNNRRLDNKFNIFEGMFKNYWFLGINCIMIGGQIMIIFVGGSALKVTPLNGPQWALCIICALCCLPWAVVLRLIPDRHFAVVFNFVLNCTTFILKPISKAFKVVFSPIGHGIHAIGSSLKRVTLRLFRKDTAKNPSVVDEEATALTDMNRLPTPSSRLQTPASGPPMTPPTAVPPIMVTAV